MVCLDAQALKHLPPYSMVVMAVAMVSQGATSAGMYVGRVFLERKTLKF